MTGAASLTVESLADLPSPLNAIVPATEMGVMVVLFGAAATLTLRRSRSVTLALLAAVWSAVVGMSLVCAWGLLLQLAVLQSRGQGSLGNTVDSAIQHMVIAPIVAVAIAATLLHRSSRPRAKLALALLDIVLVTAGIGLLVFAASLERAERPPFVVAGMLLTAAALASAPAVLRSWR